MGGWMNRGPYDRLRRRLTVALVLVAGGLLVASLTLLLSPSGTNRTTAQNTLSNKSCQPASACSSAIASANTAGKHLGKGSAAHTPTPSATPTASKTPAPTATPVPALAPTATPAPTSSPTATPAPTPSPTATPAPTPSPTATPAPTPTPISSSPPPASGYFGLKPVGSWSSLPTDAQCAAQVHYSTWEPRPENSQQDHTIPAPGAMAASFASRPRALGGSYNSLWDSWLLRRVDGQ